MSEERATYIKRKRTALKGEITKLRQAITRRELDPLNVRLRFKRLAEHFHQFEELNFELEAVDNSENAAALNEAQFTDVQNVFYELNALVESTPAPGGSRSNEDGSIPVQGFGHSTFVEKQKSVKLPVADLPKFNGAYHEWISFKNEFESMIRSRTDIDDVNKFIYLRSSLTGAAAKKLALLSNTAESYKKGWDILTELYEKKRLLLTSHYNALFDLAVPIQTSSIEALSKLADDAQQHLAMLKELGAVPDEGMVVCWVQKALPSDVSDEWAKTLSSNVMPSFKDFYSFIHDYVDRKCDSTRQTGQPQDTPRKRSQNREFQGAKSRKSNSGARSFVTGTTGMCAHCKQAHHTYRCAEFEALNTQQRWDSIKSSGACCNCLSFHKDVCKSTLCKKCSKPHHTLLHSEKRGPVNKNVSNGKAQNGEVQTPGNASKST